MTKRSNNEMMHSPQEECVANVPKKAAVASGSNINEGAGPSIPLEQRSESTLQANRKRYIQYRDPESIMNDLGSVFAALIFSALAPIGTSAIYTKKDKSTVLEYLRQKANPSYWNESLGMDLLRFLCMKIPDWDASFFQECVDVINSNKSLGDDYDLAKYMIRNKDVFWKVLKLEERFCVLLNQVNIDLDQFVENAQGVPLIEVALQAKNYQAARCILSKTGHVPNIIKGTLKDRIEEIGSRWKGLHTMYELWRKASWGEEEENVKRNCGSLLYRKLLLHHTNQQNFCEMIKVLRGQNIDLSMSGRIFRNSEATGIKMKTLLNNLPKDSLMLILESFRRQHFVSVNLGWEFFKSLSHLRIPECEICEVIVKIAELLDNTGNHTDSDASFPLKESGTDPLWRSKSLYLTTLVRNRPKVALYLHKFLGFKVTATFWEDAGVSTQEKEMAKIYHAVTTSQESNISLCCICHERQDNGNQLLLLPNCPHVFHEECVNNHCARGASPTSCPQCRQTFSRGQCHRINL